MERCWQKLYRRADAKALEEHAAAPRNAPVVNGPGLRNGGTPRLVVKRRGVRGGAIQ